MTSVGSGHLWQACFRRRPWIPCGGWICGGRERPEAGGPVARVQERTDKARAVGPCRVLEQKGHSEGINSTLGWRPSGPDLQLPALPV